MFGRGEGEKGRRERHKTEKAAHLNHGPTYTVEECHLRAAWPVETAALPLAAEPAKSVIPSAGRSSHRQSDVAMSLGLLC